LDRPLEHGVPRILKHCPASPWKVLSLSTTPSIHWQGRPLRLLFGSKGKSRLDYKRVSGALNRVLKAEVASSLVLVRQLFARHTGAVSHRRVCKSQMKHHPQWAASKQWRNVIKCFQTVMTLLLYESAMSRAHCGSCEASIPARDIEDGDGQCINNNSCPPRLNTAYHCSIIASVHNTTKQRLHVLHGCESYSA